MFWSSQTNASVKINAKSGKNLEQFDPPEDSRVKAVKMRSKREKETSKRVSSSPPSRKKFCL